jgi:hypothetical protein
MKEMVEAILENLSSREVFLFRVCCSGCGAEYGNKPRRFSKAGVEPENGNRRVIFDVLYEQELRQARQFAIRDAAEHMNYCPVCKRLVCDGCFMICDDLDLCRECACKLGQTGQSVLHGIVEEAVS